MGMSKSPSKAKVLDKPSVWTQLIYIYIRVNNIVAQRHLYRNHGEVEHPNSHASVDSSIEQTIHSVFKLLFISTDTLLYK